MDRIQQSKLPPMVHSLLQKGNGKEQIGGTSCQRACISHKSTKHIAQKQKQMLLLHKAEAPGRLAGNKPIPNQSNTPGYKDTIKMQFH